MIKKKVSFRPKVTQAVEEPKGPKIRDLLFVNPPLTEDQRKHRKNEKKRIAEQRAKTVDKDAGDEKNEAAIDDSLSEELSLVPKVKMGPDGKLVLDESSTIINRNNPIKSQDAIIEDDEDIISRTTYNSFRRKPSTSKWSNEDTQKFYNALTIFGTDFSMMESFLFSGHRSRTELHKKFKREERANKNKIDLALSNRITLSSEELQELRDVL